LPVEPEKEEHRIKITLGAGFLCFVSFSWRKEMKEYYVSKDKK